MTGEHGSTGTAARTGRGRRRIGVALAALGLCAVGSVVLSRIASAQTGGAQVGSPMMLVFALGALSLAPFLVIMLSSFVKISVVLSIVRNAIGTQQIPPNQVVTGFSFVLTIFVMMPVAQEVYRVANISPFSDSAMVSERSVREIFEGAKRGKEPVRAFLERHAHSDDRVLFTQLAQGLSGKVEPRIDPRSFQVLIPSFVTSELKEAFLLGFIIFIPFLVIDMVTANILMALGMMMLSPTTISLPFKLLLFVLVDGWALIVKGLVMDYMPR